MKVSKTATTRILFAFFAVTILLFAAGATWAQIESPPKKRLKNPAVVKGAIGGESHDGYVIRVRKNQTLQVQIAWREKDDATAQFVVSRSADFFAGDVMRGIKTGDEKSWRGKIDKTGDYYIYVTAHPAANYTLKISVK